MRLPRVLMFTATYDKKDYCLDEWAENVLTFTYKHFDKIIIDNTNDNGEYFEALKTRFEPMGFKVYHVERGNSSREALARSQNLARKIFLEGDYDYLFSLESDIFPKMNIIDALISHNLDIVTGLYMIGSEEKDTRTPCITIPHYIKEKGTWGTRLLKPEEFIEYINQGPKLVAAGGMGCCMMYRDVIEKVAFTYIPGHNAHSDVFFFLDTARKNYLTVVDTDLFCKHKNSEWEDVSDR